MAERYERAVADHVAAVEHVRDLLPEVDALARRLVALYGRGGRVYTFGNGGSAADAQHFAEELVGRFARERRPLAAQSLSVDASVLTCIANDWSFDEIFERQVRAFVGRGDLAAGFSTSGRSPNVVRGLAAARASAATASASAPRLRKPTTTSAPARASIRTVAAPMPRDAPLTTARRPRRSITAPPPPGRR